MSLPQRAHVNLSYYKSMHMAYNYVCYKYLLITFVHVLNDGQNMYTALHFGMLSHLQALSSNADVSFP